VKTCIVSGALANKPHNGGEAWVRLSWARGMQRLGWDVIFVEQLDEQTADAVDYFRAATRAFELPACLIGVDSSIPASADLLINISGHLPPASPLFERIRTKVYVDIDPGYTQIWQEQGLLDLTGHDHYYTIAQNIGAPDCSIPTGKLNWRTILQPVVLDDWPILPPPAEMTFTTVAAWRRSFGNVTYNGSTFGQKAHEFRKKIDLPRRSPHAFEIALQIYDGDHKDRDVLTANGWRLVAPKAVADTPQDFRRYVQQSAAEFSVAQGIYVATKSGWFSDRSIRYLATGRPVLVQSTGALGVPVGVGIVPFDDVESAIAGADRIVRDYKDHAAAARQLAENHFDSNKVLTNLLGGI
jgi:hypothetical protein